MLTYYDVLSVDPSAELGTIRRAWRVKIRLLHPDRHRDEPVEVQEEAARETRRVNKAWDVLGDPQKRRDYDAHLARLGDRDVAREPARRAGAQDDDNDDRGGRIWLSSRSYLTVASTLIIVLAFGFVVAGAVLLAQMTQ